MFKRTGRKGTRAARAGDWWANIRTGKLCYKRVRLCADQGVSQRWHIELQAAVDRVKGGEPADTNKLTAAGVPRRLWESLGLISRLAQARQTTWAQHVVAYADELKAGGCNAAYIAKMKSTLESVGTAKGWGTIADASRSDLVGYLKDRGGEVGARTLNNIRNSVRSFMRWAVKTGRIDKAALEVVDVPLPDPKQDRRTVRRALTDEEIRLLLTHVAGTDREIIYRFALASGLRWSECKRLQWRDVDLERSMLRLRPEATKSKRADKVPLSADIAARMARLKLLRPFDPPAAPVFPKLPEWKQWKGDVVAAGIPYKDDQDRIAGFHSLRVTLGTRLDRMGLPVKSRMAIMRHEDPNVSYDVYSDVGQKELADDVNRLPTYPDIEAVARANGTDGKALKIDSDPRKKERTQTRTRAGDESCPSFASIGEGGQRKQSMNTGRLSSFDCDCRQLGKCGREESNLHDLAITRT